MTLTPDPLPTQGVGAARPGADGAMPPHALDLASLVERALGRYPYGGIVTVPPPASEIVPAASFLDPETLRAAIVRAVDGANIREEVDLRPAASRWTRQYAGSLLSTVLVALAHGISLDLSIERCGTVIRNHLPGALYLDRPETGALFWPERGTSVWAGGRQATSLDELRAHLVDGLIARHLAPLIERVLDLMKLSPDVLWSNVAEHADLVYEAARARLSGHEIAPFEADAAALLEAITLPGPDGPNPLRGWIERDPVDEPDFPRPMQLRRICCLHYLIPDRIGRLCSNCPLAAREQRISVTRSARGGHSLTSTAVQAGGPVATVGGTLPAPGSAAPGFSLPATGGREITLADYHGRQPVVVYFYVTDNSAACTAEALSFRERYQDFQAQGVEVLGISVDDVASHEQFRQKYDLPFSLLSDTRHEVAARYGVWQRTRLGSREIEGVIRTTFVVNVEGSIQAIFTDVRGGRHADQVLAVFA